MGMKSYTKLRIIYPAVFLTLLIIFSLNVTVLAAEEDTIVDGIYLEDIHLGGLTKEEADAVVEEYIQKVKDSSLTLTLPKDIGENKPELQTALGELGLECQNPNLLKGVLDYAKSGNLILQYEARKDLKVNNIVYELKLTLDEASIQAYISDNCGQFNIDPVDAVITRVDGSFQVTESNPGIIIDEAATLTQIMELAAPENLKAGKGINVELIAAVTEPARSTETLNTIKDLLGSKTTNYSLSGSQAGRNANLVVGTSKINGAVIMPGEEYSANAAMEPYTSDLGWYKAASYSPDGGIEYTYGGGICQISTTFYNAALFAELEIIQRQPHSMLVGYVPYGLDAAIAGSSKDLKIRNNYETPIYIECYANGGELVFNIYGQENRPANRTIQFTTDSSGIYTPAVEYVDDPSLPLGTEMVVKEATKGGTAMSFKEIYVDGQLVERIQLSTDRYRVQSAVIHRGTNTEVSATEESPETGSETGTNTDPGTGGSTSPASPADPSSEGGSQEGQPEDSGENTGE